MGLSVNPDTAKTISVYRFRGSGFNVQGSPQEAKKTVFVQKLDSPYPLT
jgi:hypothetical protein